MNSREVGMFQTTEHNRSYLAAGALGSNGPPMEYERKGGWFVTKTQAFLIGVLFVLAVVVAAFLGRISVSKYPSTAPTECKVEKAAIYPTVPPVAPEVEEEKETQKGGKPSEKLFDLPESLYKIQPVNYTLSLELSDRKIGNPGEEVTFPYEGNVTITIHPEEELSSLTLQVENLHIVPASLSLVKKKHPENKQEESSFFSFLHSNEEDPKSKLRLAIKSYNPEEGVLVLGTNEPLVPTELYDLHLEFFGSVQQLPYGLFYIDTKRQEQPYIFTTNLGAPYARTVFPCFEKPGQKAQIQVNVKTPPNFIATASSYIQSTTDKSGSDHWDNFEPTPRMALDQLGIVVTTTGYKPKIKSSDIIQRYTIWTRSEVNEEEMEYLLDKGLDLVQFYGSYFGDRIPVKKLDLFAIPAFNARNKGYREIAILRESEALVKADSTSAKAKEITARLLSTEVARQWIGNMVTLKSNKELHLKNALLNFVSIDGVRKIEPDWKYENRIIIDVIQKSLHNHTDVSDDGFGPEIFISEKKAASSDNNISLYKGVGLLRMLKNAVTDHIFNSSVNKFLQDGVKKEYISFESLWNDISAKVAESNDAVKLPSEVSIAKIVTSWIEGKGYPLLNVTRNYKTGFATFDSKNFTSEAKPEETLWHIPVFYTTGNEKEFDKPVQKFWLAPTESNHLELKAKGGQPVAATSWLLVNPQYAGYYRVNYDKQNWALLRAAVSNKEIPPVAVSQLIDDSFSLAHKDIIAYEIPLNFVANLTCNNEDDAIVWHSVLNHLLKLNSLMYNSTIPDTFQQFGRRIIDPATIYFSEDRTNLTHTEHVLKSDVWFANCVLEDENKVSEATSMFKSWFNAEHQLKIQVHPDLKYPILCCALKNGTRADYDTIYAEYSKIEDYTSTEKIVFLKSLLYSKAPSAFNDLMKGITEHGSILEKVHLSNIAWNSVRSIPWISNDAFNFLLSNFKDTIYTVFSKYPVVLSTILDGATESINTQDQLNKFTEFSKSNEKELQGLEDVINEITQRASRNIKWKQDHEEHIVKWLKKNISLQASKPVTPVSNPEPASPREKATNTTSTVNPTTKPSENGQASSDTQRQRRAVNNADGVKESGQKLNGTQPEETICSSALSTVILSLPVLLLVCSIVINYSFIY